MFSLSSNGTGEVLAKRLATLGAKLIISARNEAELQRVKSQLAGTHSISSFLWILKYPFLFISSFICGRKSGKHAPDDVIILPLDLTSGESKLAEAVQKAESFFDGAGVDYLIHNAAFERPVCHIYCKI